MTDRDWFILPGVQGEFFRFLDIVCDYMSPVPKLHNKPLLISGDSGVGKSLFIDVARQVFLHNSSNNDKYSRTQNTGASIGKNNWENKANNFLKVNCSSFQMELADSELFGHVKGAFSGATKDKAGIVETTNHGLLILDEIGELPDPVQAKLLIFIEEGEYRRVGSNETRYSDVKIIGTTNKKKKDLRLDFWHRFYHFILPPLHERRLDILYYILAKYPSVFHRLTAQHALSLLAYHWPGNFRELDEAITTICAEDNIYKTHEKIGLKKLFIPIDMRKTSLAYLYPANFCNALLSFGFDVSKLNSIILKFGLEIPLSYSSDTEFFKLLTVTFNASGKTNSFEKNIKSKINSMLADIGPIKFSFNSSMIPGLDLPMFDQRISDFASKENLQMSNLLSDIKKNTYGIFIDLHSDVQKILDGYNDNFHFYNDVEIKLNTLNSFFDFLSHIYLLGRIDKIEYAGECFNAVCKLFLKNININSNVFDDYAPFIDDRDEDTPAQRKILVKLNSNSIILSAVNFITKNKSIIPARYKGDMSWRSYVKSWLANDRADAPASPKDHLIDVIEINFLDYSQDELLKKYYAFILSKFKTFSAASRHVGVPSSTLWNRMIALGMDPKKKY